MSIRMRQEVERQIIAAIVDAAITAGYRLAVSLERGYDLEEGNPMLGTKDRDAVITEAMAGDESHLFIMPAEGPVRGDDGKIISIGWVLFVLGNDGYDVVSDYTTNLDELGLMTAADAISERYQ